MKAEQGKPTSQWSSDILGHCLVLGGLTASFAFLCYGPAIRRILPPEDQEWTPAKEIFLKRWFRISSIVMLGMTIGNYTGISFGDNASSHWAHVQIPYVLTLANAGFYYLFTLLPLFLCLLSLSKDLERASQRPSLLRGFNPTDHQKCFGIAPIGNGLVISIFIFLYFLLVPIIVQATFYQSLPGGSISPGSIFAGIFSSFVFRRICITPLGELQKQLGEKQLALLEDKKKELIVVKQAFSENAEFPAYYETISAERRLIAEQKLIPFLKPFAFLGAFVAVSSVVVSVTTWLKGFFG